METIMIEIYIIGEKDNCEVYYIPPSMIPRENEMIQMNDWRIQGNNKLKHFQVYEIEKVFDEKGLYLKIYTI